jgi:hypothetical protein
MLNTDTAQIPGAVDTLVNTSGGGQDLATSGVGTGETGMGDLDGLTQSGTFAGQPTFTTTPGTTVDDITGDITNADGTYAGNIVDEVALTGAAPSGITGDPIDVGIPDNESGFVDPLGTMSGAPVVGDFSEPTTGTISDDRLNEVIGGQPMAAGPFDYLQEQTPLSQVQVPGLDYSQAAIDAERLAGYTPSFGTVNELTDDPTMQETISNAFTSARQGIGDLATASVDKIQEVGQSIANTIGGIYNGVDQTISVFGREINVPATLAGIAASQVVGAPINIAFGLAKAIGGTLPQYEPTFEETTLINKLGVTEDGKFAGDPNTSAYAGLNAVSAFGDPVETAQNRIDTRNNTIATNPNISQEFIDNTRKMEEEHDRVTNELGDIDTTATTGDAKEAEEAAKETRTETRDRMAGVTTGDASVAEEEAAKDKEEAAAAAADQASIDRGQSLHGGPEGTTGGTTGGAAPGTGAQGPAGGATNNGGGGNGGGGGGTHICTASYANNLITVLDFKSLKKYGIKLRRNDKYLMKAYDWFGPKLAAAVKKGKLVNFAKHSTSMWKYEQTKEDVSFKIKFMSRLHKIITRPILRALGALLTIKEKLTK